MALLSSVKQKITVESTRYRSAVSEFIMQTMGKSVNWLIDRVDTLEAAIEAQPISDVSSVSVTLTSPSTYTVPTGKTLYAVAFVTVANTSILVNAAPFAGPFPVNTAYPLVLGAGSTVEINITGGAIMRGVVFGSTSIVIP